MCYSLTCISLLWLFFGNYAKREILANKHRNKHHFINLYSC